MVVYIGILRDIFESRRHLQDTGVYSPIFGLVGCGAGGVAGCYIREKWYYWLQ